MKKSEKYVTNDGLVVDVWPLGNDNVVIEYKGRRMVRNRAVLDSQLLPLNEVALSGDRVELEFLDTGERVAYELVDSYTVFKVKRLGGNHYSNRLYEYTQSDAQPQNGTISTDSPLGSALVHKTRGAVAEYSVGPDKMRVRILDINKKAVS